VKLWHVEYLNRRPQRVYCLAEYAAGQGIYSLDAEDQVVVGCKGGNIQLFSPQLELVRTLTSDHKVVKCVRFTDNAAVFVSSGNDGAVNWFDSREKTALFQTAASQKRSAVNFLHFSHSGLLLSADMAGGVQIHDPRWLEHPLARIRIWRDVQKRKINKPVFVGNRVCSLGKSFVFIFS
jgi:WD40 repeat protein